MKPIKEAIPPRRWSDDEPVVKRPRLRGFRVPTFGETSWDLSCMGRRPNKARYTISFAGLMPQRALMAKELFAHRLNYRLPSSRRRKAAGGYKADTCLLMLVQLRRLFAFMDAHGVERVRDLTQGDLDVYARALAEALPGQSQKMTRAAALQVAVWLWESREHLSEGGLGFDPWFGKSTMKVVGYVRPDETVTPRIPETVIAMLLRWALEYVDVFASDILAAGQALRQASALVQVRAGEGEPERFARYAALLETEGRPLPATESAGRVVACRFLVAAQACVSEVWLLSSAGRTASRAAVRKSGLELHCLPPPHQASASRERAIVRCSTVVGLTNESRHLTAAAYVICAYLSGMRDSEVQDLRRGCVEVMRDERGVVYRHKVRGLTHKGQDLPLERTWVVIEPVARAIAVLERLTAAHFAATGDDHLFVHHDFSDPDRHPLLGERVVALINGFAAHCGDVLAPRVAQDRADDAAGGPSALGPIPDGPNGHWHLTTRQFRKTLAWHIANRKFGVIAGMTQYGHSTAQMFEGYAGDPHSGFRAEVAHEEFLARLGDVSRMYADALVGVATAGPMAEELKAEFARIQAEIGDHKGEVVDDARFGQLLRMRAASLRVGEVAHCFYEPSQARCQAHLALERRVDAYSGDGDR